MKINVWTTLKMYPHTTPAENCILQQISYIMRVIRLKYDSMSSRMNTIKLNCILPVEYFNIRGINALSWAWVIFSTGVGIPSRISGGSSYRVGSSGIGGGACCANAVSSWSIIVTRKFLTFRQKWIKS